MPIAKGMIDMATTYTPTRATQEMRGHSYEELLFARGLGRSVQEFAQIVKGEKKGQNAREFIEQMIKEAEELKIEPSCRTPTRMRGNRTDTASFTPSPLSAN
jgi:hypothetical protein